MTVGRTRAAWAATGVTLTLLAAACGGDDGGGPTAGSAPASTAASATSAASGSTASTSTAAPGPRPTSIEEWEELWAQERAAVVEKIESNGWGKSEDGTTLEGPAGFTIDLTQCPEAWSDTEGLTDTEIKIGNTTALSGTAADFGNLSRTAAAWFDHHSEQGSFTDSLGKTRSINYLVRDDVYDATRTIPLVDELLDSERVFAIQTLGTPAGLRVYDRINDACVPHPLTTSGSPAWGDPVNHPWTTGSLLSYGTEAVIWGTFIDQHIDELTEDDGTATVAALVANSDFGLAYEGAFRAVIADSPNSDKIEFITEKLEITAPVVTDAMTTLAAQDPDVFLTMTGAVQCTQIINEVASNGMAETLEYGFMSSVCKSSAYVGRDKVGGDGSQSDGWYIVGGGQKDINSEANEDDGFSPWAREFLAGYGIDSKESSQLGNGFFQAWVWTQALQIAGELEGGLTRTNLILALRAFEGTSPVHLDGISMNMNGNEDAYLLEGSDVSVYDAEQQTWVVEDLVELSGQTANCAWDTSINACA